MIRLAVSFLILASFAGVASADTCKAQATAKSLHGAAETSFLKKCASDAKAKCETDAKTKNLHGAAETSFVKKCVSDAKGA
ncbi:MAG: hypothetical protein JNN24_14565 [Hyphomicrobium zavarzinii]|jgi:hypothetical protein|uniref:hypothetical protein n=1 Tax=Hyphomicrobium TaxID=81 RepID=UPI0003781841|nr:MULTISPECIES: hypothetical protein [Hyphomicrobium]MBL8846985.1 hypothetical protein [Hyphomicrobium zavarzinii]WBT36488.1 hypothetical protein PE058_12565 [Hyphomicrobium sp. DMF-1]HML42253.1 hypothetical protein [Hyphomicrobium zavarzinii]